MINALLIHDFSLLVTSVEKYDLVIKSTPYTYFVINQNAVVL
jgi:hypothetical protein